MDQKYKKKTHAYDAQVQLKIMVTKIAIFTKLDD